MMKRLPILLLLLLLLVPAAGAASALDTLYLSFRPCEDGASLPVDAIAWTESGGKYYLMLPGVADLQDARLWYDGTDASITVNGQEIRSGTRFSGIDEGSVLTVSSSKKTYSVTVMRGSAISAFFITTESGSMAAVDKKKGIEEAGDALFIEPDGRVAYEGGMEYIRLRGNVATTLDKKNYSVKLESGANFLKMGKAKCWVLLGSGRDNSILRNQIVYEMAAYVGLQYTPQVAQVDVYLDHDYHGVYLLAEKIEVDDDRVDIADLEEANKAVNDQPLDSYSIVGNLGQSKKNTSKAYRLDHDPEDITGGYIVEYENYRVRYGYEKVGFTTSRGKVLVVKAPKHCSEAEMEYISSFMQSYENAIFAKDGIDKKTGKRYDELVDFDSLVLKYMLE